MARVEIGFGFREEVAAKIEGGLAGYCYQCGACVGDCAAAMYSPEFNPRQIMQKVLYGLEDELLTENSILWHCTNCYNCHERCPQQVKPVEVIIALKNMLADRGLSPAVADSIVETFEQTGRTVKLGKAIDRRREKFGLPPLPEVPMEEITAILDDAPGDVEGKK